MSTSTGSMTLSIHLTEDRRQRIDALASATGQSQDQLILEALDRYLVEQERRIAQLDEGLREADADEVVPHEQVLADLVAAGYATHEGIAQERTRLDALDQAS